MGKTGLHIVERIAGLLLAAIAICFITDGLAEAAAILAASALTTGGHDAALDVLLARRAGPALAYLPSGRCRSSRSPGGAGRRRLSAPGRRTPPPPVEWGEGR
jgi:hypothetical protein